MTWGAKRRKRLANFLGDVAKIIAAGAVVAPLVQPGKVSSGLVLAGMLMALAFLAVSLVIEKEE